MIPPIAFFSGVPTTFYPLPALAVLPTLLLAPLGLWKAAAAVPTVLFFIWNPGLFRGEAKVPKRSYVLLAIAIVLTIVDFVVGWRWGLQYQGAKYTYVVCAINVGWITFLSLAFVRGWRKTSFGHSLFLHLMLFVWLAWYAFPYLGELP